MRQVEALALMLLLISGLFGFGFSVCRDFMDMDESSMSGACQDEDHCRKSCRYGPEEAPAVHEKVQLQTFPHAVAVSVLSLTPPLSPHLHGFYGAFSLEVHGKISTGEVYLQNASFLI